MSEEKYYVLTVQSGCDLRHHDFEKALDGTYLFTKEEAKAKVCSPMLQAFMPVAVPASYLGKVIRQLQPKQTRE